MVNLGCWNIEQWVIVLVKVEVAAALVVAAVVVAAVVAVEAKSYWTCPTNLNHFGVQS
jgi:hypothetical protein